jgi:L-iditol 2-dehydrogenase
MREVEVPVPGPGEILVRVRAATTCGTDLKIFRRGHPKFPFPFVFGHEFGGDVAAVGAGVDKFKVGMRVTANVFGECGECFFCQKSQGNLCENLEYNFGAFAEYHLIPASIVKKNTFILPEQLTCAEAAIVEPLVCVVHAVRKIAIQPSERVAVIGAGGPISLLFIQLLRQAGAGEVIAIGRSQTRLNAARQLGASTVINAHEVDPLEFVDEITAGYGVDAVVECAGTLEAWLSAVKMVRRGGRVLWFGGLPSGTEVPVDAARVHYGEIDLLNSHGGTAEDAAIAFDLIASRKVDARALITHEMPLSQVGEALQLMAAGEAIKVALLPV